MNLIYYLCSIKVCTICSCLCTLFVIHKSCLDDQIMKHVFVGVRVKIIHNLLSLSLSKQNQEIDFILKLCAICNKFKIKYLNLEQVKALPDKI